MMKKIIIIVLLIAVVAIGIAFGYYSKINKTENQNVLSNDNSSNPVNNNTEKTEETSDKKVAVVYFSATGNTKKIAELIKDDANADIFEIIPKQKYTSEDLNYGDSNTRATKEQNDDNARPEIANNIDVSDYDVIFLGYPIWWGNVPKIILSFIDNTNLSGKTVIPFCTSGSSGISTSESSLKSYDSNINWISGNRFSGSASENEVSNWVNGLNY